MQNSLIFMVSESKCYFPRERRHPCDVFSIKRCINFWSRSCIDNARVEHSI